MSRKLDLSLFRGDDSDDDDLRPVAKKPVELDALKAKTFHYGATKKTKRDIEREQEERKKREEEKATELALQEFSREFENAGPSSGHGGRSGWSRKGRAFVRAGEQQEAYVPPRSMNSRPEVNVNRPVFTQSPSPPPMPKPRGKRAMDEFLEEIKANQEARDARGGRPGYGFDRRDPHQGVQETTNLCIMNLPEDVTEEVVGRLFAKVGPVGTVKIMWPRGDDHNTYGVRRSRGGLTGFVCYMRRGDAEKALQKFDGYTLGDTALRVSWSKPVHVPAQAAYHQRSSSRSVSPPRRGARHTRSRSPSDTPALTSSEREARRSYWLNQVTPEQRLSLEPVLEKIRRDGSNYLNALKEAEKDNVRFAFLLDDKAPEYHLLQFTIDPDYIFPPVALPAFHEEGDAACYSSDSAEHSEQERTPKVELSPLARRRFEAMLRGLNGKRVEIARAMEYAVKRADAYDTVIDIISQSLCIYDTPVPKKIARLNLVSDILHNSASSLPNVWRYRMGFEKRLPAVFEHFAQVHADLLEHRGTIAASVFIQQADAVLSVWERWFVFTSEVLDTFRKLLHAECTIQSLKEDAERASAAALQDIQKPTVSKSAGFKSSFKPISLSAAAAKTEENGTPGLAEGRLAAEYEDVDGEPVGGDDVDGEAMEDLDGEDMDGEPIDGEPTEGIGGEDLDGEDLDGEAM